MKKLWLEEEEKVFLARFTDSSMANDTDNKYSFVNDFWRVKTYVKDEDKLKPQLERAFPEPYQVAQYYSGGTWNDYNQPFVIQIGLCNLNCSWCFVNEDLRNLKNGEYFSAKEVVDLWLKNTESGILRISGGEPFLAPEFILEIGEALLDLGMEKRFLWIDTNLLGQGYEKVVQRLSELYIPFGICGCFKGFDEEEFESNTGVSKDQFETQFQNAKTILDNLGACGELFFYVPEILNPYDHEIVNIKIESFIKNLQTKVHPNAPLRTTVLDIKQYSTNKDRMIQERLKSGVTKDHWISLLEKTYPMDLVWLPQYQISMKEED